MAVAYGAGDAVDPRGELFEGDAGLLLRVQQYVGPADLRGAGAAHRFNQRQQS